MKVHTEMGEEASNLKESLEKQIFSLNERLKESEKYKSTFLSNMRNEIINPLSSILILSKNVLQSPVVDDPQIRKSIELIYQETFALNFHINAVSLAAEIETGECYPQLALVSPESIISETLQAFEYLVNKKSLRLTILQDFDGKLYGDPDKLQMIMMCLFYYIINNCKSGEEISVKTYVKDTHLYIEVTNTSVFGVAINHFDQTDFKKVTILNEGLGDLQLSICKSLTEILGGKMDVRRKEKEIAAIRCTIPTGNYHQNGDVFEQQSLFFH